MKVLHSLANGVAAALFVCRGNWNLNRDWRRCKYKGRTDFHSDKKLVDQESKCGNLGQKRQRVAHFWVLPHCVAGTVALVLTCHFEDFNWRCVSGGCMQRSYMLWIDRKRRAVICRDNFFSWGLGVFWGSSYPERGYVLVFVVCLFRHSNKREPYLQFRFYIRQKQGLLSRT